ncbi:FAD-dependent oxidoreductase [Algimonas ampicilliniresistens]|uniref:FAD-dependent oxidoreductase n=1 Tax=Algimonas ampicilliniresistens TaxID=1298735 RepID=A0ABQ5V5I6_9PROT|nr:FAD-dependent oxidoreductase [Algimonas ampicilliniresistens]GLQ22803.1 FAD-dependent oxidoreductase [Algimonas ampicilliniresistens]
MKIAIIGAGMAGLTAARRLSDKHEVELFDKSRGVGGRMSTRYAGDYEFDHGAQYFTITDPEFQFLIDAIADNGCATRWDSRGLYLRDGELTKDTGRPRWVGSPRMNVIAKALAQGLQINLGRRVSSISGSAGNLSLAFEEGGSEGPFDRVICTAPAPQAAAMLPPNSLLQSVLADVHMHACFALMVGWAEPFDPGWDSLRVTDLPISWLALNASKPGRNPAVPTLVVHAAPAWSDNHADADRDWVQSIMLGAASVLCDRKLDQAPHIALHRWLYAYSNAGVGQDCLIDPDRGVVLAGDWCVGGRVEGAFVSGRAAANHILASD